MAKRRHPLSRQKKTSTTIAVLGLGAGIAAYFLFVRKKKVTPTITSSGATVKRIPIANAAPDAYVKGSDANKALTAAQDGWYALHPDEPFVNDDGTCNILPEFDDGTDIPGCLNQSPPSD